MGIKYEPHLDSRHKNIRLGSLGIQATQEKTVLVLRLRHLHSHLEICETKTNASVRCAQEEKIFLFLASTSSYIHTRFYCSCVYVYAWI